MNVLDRIESDIGGYCAQEQVVARTQRRYADVFALQTRYAADASVRKQLETADVLTADDRDGLAGINWNDEGWRVICGEVDLPASERESSADPGIRRHVADVSKAFPRATALRRHTEARCKCR